jgi:hypothetical protein
MSAKTVSLICRVTKISFLRYVHFNFLPESLFLKLFRAKLFCNSFFFKEIKHFSISFHINRFFIINCYLSILLTAEFSPFLRLRRRSRDDTVRRICSEGCMCIFFGFFLLFLSLSISKPEENSLRLRQFKPLFFEV